MNVDLSYLIPRFCSKYKLTVGNMLSDKFRVPFNKLKCISITCQGVGTSRLCAFHSCLPEAVKLVVTAALGWPPFQPPWTRGQGVTLGFSAP